MYIFINTHFRLPAVEYLLKDGCSQTWLVGHNLVTITTSGCPSGPIRNSLCERCAQMAKVYTLSPKSSSDSSAAMVPVITESGVANQSAATSNAMNTNSVQDHRAIVTYDHRYKKIALQHSSGNESASSTDFISSSSTTSQQAQRQASNSSTASLEALSRRDSNPETGGNDLGINPIGSTTTSGLCASPICVRSCTLWAEILIRRPTGNISWITRIQNPISSECLGYDIPFSNIASLFLPTSYGGLYGPDFPAIERSIDYQEPISLEEQILPTDELLPCNFDLKMDLGIYNKNLKASSAKSMICKNRQLLRQEEITSNIAVNVAGSAAIDIPKSITSKRGKEALSGSVSDGEADENSMAFEGDEIRTRKPVRRVNSSPEMSSSWRNNFLNNKRSPLRRDILQSEMCDENEMIVRDTHSLQQKKKCIQYSKVSCEAIPEEIAGSTPPQYQLNPIVNTETNIIGDERLLVGNALNTVEDSDPVFQQTSSESASIKCNINPGINNQINITRTNDRGNSNSNKPLHNSSAYQNVTRSTSNVTVTVSKSPSFGSHQSLTKSSSGSNAINLVADSDDYNNNGGGGEMMRGRSKTISVVREVNNGKTRTNNNFRVFNTNKPQINTKLCMHPSFIFMQLYHTGPHNVGDVPIKVPIDQMGAVSLLDLAPPFETHKIGVLYVGYGQCNNVIEILRNSHGSTRYVEFLRSIGTLISLKEAVQNNLFITLDTGGSDGKFTYIWKDDIVHVSISKSSKNYVLIIGGFVWFSYE